MKGKVGSPRAIQTLAELQKADRRLDRRRREVNRVLAAMQKRGASLHFQYVNGRAIWRTSDGEFVTPEAAVVVIAHGSVTGCGDSLFASALGQTWRWVA
jgi:hypothetical protein